MEKNKRTVMGNDPTFVPFLALPGYYLKKFTSCDIPMFLLLVNHVTSAGNICMGMFRHGSTTATWDAGP